MRALGFNSNIKKIVLSMAFLAFVLTSSLFVFGTNAHAVDDPPSGTDDNGASYIFNPSGEASVTGGFSFKYPSITVSAGESTAYGVESKFNSSFDNSTHNLESGGRLDRYSTTEAGIAKYSGYIYVANGWYNPAMTAASGSNFPTPEGSCRFRLILTVDTENKTITANGGPYNETLNDTYAIWDDDYGYPRYAPRTDTSVPSNSISSYCDLTSEAINYYIQYLVDTSPFTYNVPDISPTRTGQKVIAKYKMTTSSGQSTTAKAELLAKPLVGLVLYNKAGENKGEITTTDRSRVTEGSGATTAQRTYSMWQTGRFFDVPKGKGYKVCLQDKPTVCSNPFEVANKDITIAVPGTGYDAVEIASIPVAVAVKQEASCGNQVKGIGWIVCPIIDFMGFIVDGSYGVVSSLLTTPKIDTSTGTTNGMYTAWKLMRDFANVAFVIVFLIIIFSQLTNIGISNYGIKKLLPRIIIAAILVNLSYFICAIAVDLSNILGVSLKQALNGMGASMPPPKVGSGTGWTWLIGLLVGGSVLIYAGLSVLLPALISALVAIVVAFLVLTIRQALIIILIVVSPIAFIAFLLPNTEKLFKKWQDLFTTLLLMFPIVSMIFGASALASKIIISTADENFFLQVMGTLVAIIPLFITPILMKTAGSTLGNIGSKIQGLSKKPQDALNKGAAGIRERELARKNNRAANSTRPGLRRGLLRRRARLDAIKQNQESEKTRTMTNYLADRSTTNKGGFADKMSAGGSAGAKDRVMARAITEKDKQDNAEIETQVTLMKSKYGQEEMIVKAGEELDAALNGGDEMKAKAAQRLLFTQGSKGLDKLHDVIEANLKDNVIEDKDSAGNVIGTHAAAGKEELVKTTYSLRKEIAAQNIKAKDSTLATWSYTKNAVLEKVGGNTDVINSLTPEELSTQRPRVLEDALKGGTLETSLAVSVVTNPNLNKNLDKNTQPKIVESILDHVKNNGANTEAHIATAILKDDNLNARLSTTMRQQLEMAVAGKAPAPAPAPYSGPAPAPYSGPAPAAYYPSNPTNTASSPPPNNNPYFSGPSSGSSQPAANSPYFSGPNTGTGQINHTPTPPPPTTPPTTPPTPPPTPSAPRPTTIPGAVDQYGNPLNKI